MTTDHIEERPMRRYEYHHTLMMKHELTDALTQLGKEGWRLHWISNETYLDKSREYHRVIMERCYIE